MQPTLAYLVLWARHQTRRDKTEKFILLTNPWFLILQILMLLLFILVEYVTRKFMTLTKLYCVKVGAISGFIAFVQDLMHRLTHFSRVKFMLNGCVTNV